MPDSSAGPDLSPDASTEDEWSEDDTGAEHDEWSEDGWSEDEGWAEHDEWSEDEWSEEDHPGTGSDPSDDEPVLIELEADDEDGPEHFGRLPYFPGLDGIRALAVMAVLLFHAGAIGVGGTDLELPGGFLGVSTFFTLSGFLITTLLLGEHRDTARISITGFYGRRLRRLMPAALAALALAVLFGATVADSAQQAGLRGDVLSSLFYVANWHFIAEDISYAEAFGQPSPVLHFWSLAIEEQFYILFPLLVTWVLLTFARARRALGIILGVIAVVSVGQALLLDLSADRVYFGTDTRAAELLVGALLAVILFNPRVTGAIADRPAVRGALGLLGLGALGLTAFAWATVDQRERWLYDGGLGAYALVSGMVVLGAILPGSPVRALLGVAPLRAIGRISYGLYLYHWPVFLWLTPARVDLEPLPLLGLRLGVTTLLAVVSYHVLEMPVRRRRFLAGRVDPLRAAPVAVIALILATLMVTRGDAPAGIELDGDDRAMPGGGALVGTPPPVPGATYRELTPEERAILEAGGVRLPDQPGVTTTTRASTTTEEPSTTEAGQGEPAPPPTEPAPPPTPEPPRVLKVAVVGDSATMYVGGGLVRWSQETGLIQVNIYAQLGCGIGRGGTRLNYNQPVDRQDEDIPDRCEGWAVDWPLQFGEFQPDVVLVGTGLWDVTGRKPQGEATYRIPGDPTYDAYLAGELLEATRTAASTGATVLWLDTPPFDWGRERVPPTTFPASDPARVDRLNEIIRAVVAQVPDSGVLAYRSHLDTYPGGVMSPDLRPDGLHLDLDSALDVARWLGPTIYAEWFVRHPTG